MVFKYDPGLEHDRFKQEGFVHLRDVLDADIVAHIDKFYKQSMASEANESQDWKIYGKKRQFVYDFPDDEAALEFRDGMARLIGIDPTDFTISERHLKVYDPAAEAWPAPHKDRAASMVSIGLPIHLPKGSSVCVFPELQFGANEEERAVFLTEKDHPNLSTVYESEKAVLLNESIGDVICFLGSALFHERVNPAGAAVLYIKANGDGRDPLGEDIYSRMAERATA
ncbi:MAG: hypothetical protein AAFR00_06240 [Pseudomonadota bacterium]